MSLRLAVLGSGSSGNCSLLTFGEGDSARHVLLDAGLSPRETNKRLKHFDLSLKDVDAGLLTHLDRDHFHVGWIRGVHRHELILHLHRRHYRRALVHAEIGDRLCPFDDGADLGHGIHVDNVFLAHDALGTVGFVIECAGTRLGFATDLGRVPSTLLERFVDLDILAIESNYDRDMQLASNRPASLKNRIMGGSGHLSNEQSLNAVLHVAERSRLQHIVLLHLSRQCNDPQLIERLYEVRAPHLRDRLVITNQFTPSPLLRVVDCRAGHANHPRAAADRPGSARRPIPQPLLFTVTGCGEPGEAGVIGTGP